MNPTDKPSPAARGPMRVLAFSTKGAGSNEEDRIRTLLSKTNLEMFPFDRAAKFRSMRQLVGRVRRTRPALLVMEGTGLAGGLACMLSRVLGARYVVSSGDAVGPWIAMKAPLLGPIFAIYERLLCRLASGFIGWTPYLVGRAMTFGCPRAMTAAGWSPIAFDASRAGEVRCTHPCQTQHSRQRDRFRHRGIALLVTQVSILLWP